MQADERRLYLNKTTYPEQVDRFAERSAAHRYDNDNVLAKSMLGGSREHSRLSNAARSTVKLSDVIVAWLES